MESAETSIAVIGLIAAANLLVGGGIWFRLGRVIEKQEGHDTRLTKLENAR